MVAARPSCRKEVNSRRPQSGGGAHLAPRRLTLLDAVAERAHVVEQEVGRDGSRVVAAGERHARRAADVLVVLFEERLGGDAEPVAESDTIRYRLDTMKTLSVTEVARNFRAVLDSVERDQEEIVLVRNRRQIARLVPEAPRQDALEVFGDLYRTLDEATATALSTALSSGRKGRRRRVSELRNPWAG